MPTRSTSAQHIIALGASAGGIEAIFEFFDYTPLDEVSYVVIQHLSPDHQSRLAELLTRHSKLTISLAEDHMPVERNKVYVIHHQVYMTIEAGKLRLTAKKEKKAPHRTINTFFSSLAADQGEKAIGIILSGTGTDGAEGVTAIKKAGGFILVQDPATATYADMPAHALTTGCADTVLSPRAMPRAIQHYVHGRATNPTIAAGDEPTLEAVLDLLKSQLPFDFSEYKRPTLFRRIRKQMVHHQLDRPEAYLAFLRKHPEALQALAQDFLISVTSFFRDPAAFELLEKKVIPALLAQPGAEPVKLWVAGCATGQEAYSLAILIVEYLTQAGITREVKLFATDLDQAALAVAAKGIYPAGIAREVSPARLERFFTREGENYRIRPEIRRLLVFARHDLGKHPPYCHLDLITCRNLLIYLNPSLQQKIFAQLHFGLRPGGYLVLGPSENASVLQPYVEEISRKWKVYRKTLEAPLPRFENFSLPFPPPAVVRSPAVVRAPEPPFKPQPTEALIEALLQESGQAGVCVDENLRVVQAFGAVDQYLLPKVLTFQLPELLPEPLAVAFGAAAHRALKKGERVSITGIALPASIPVRSVELL
ncbi:MAG TPA: chemotaxis protein CheB, partial [Cytophagales bacterium]